MRKFLIPLAVLLLLAGCGKPPLNADSRGRNIVAFGDSITAGYGVAEGEAYPAFLAKLTRRPVINLGVSGDTMRMGADRKSEISQHNPFIVLIEFGGNDAMKSRPLAETEKALAEIIDYVQRSGAIAVVIDTGGIFRMNAQSKMMKRMAKEKRALFVPAIMKGILNKSDLKVDTIHPNAKGHKIIADRIYEVIRPYTK